MTPVRIVRGETGNLLLAVKFGRREIKFGWFPVPCDCPCHDHGEDSHDQVSRPDVTVPDTVPDLGTTPRVTSPGPLRGSRSRTTPPRNLVNDPESLLVFDLPAPHQGGNTR